MLPTCPIGESLDRVDVTTHLPYVEVVCDRDRDRLLDASCGIILDEEKMLFITCLGYERVSVFLLVERM